MSSAILYLAIVAIWVGFLVPAWIRRPHASRSAAEADFTAEFETDAEIDVESSAEADLDGGIHVEFSRHVQVSRHAEGRHAEAGQHAEADSDAEAGRRIEIGHAEQARRVPVMHDAGLNHSEPASRGIGAEYVGDVPDHPEGGIPPRVRPSAARPSAARPSAAQASAARPSAARPSESRAQMLRARRRMLTILISLTALAGALTGIGLAGWWICVPPTGMLVVYMLLLREIAMADAETASKRRQAQVARAAHQRAREAWAASHPEPTAQIIDISRRVGDQLYDQYADAAVRAVGD